MPSSSSSSFDPFLYLDGNANDILDTSIDKYGKDGPISPISVVKSAAEWSMISASPRAEPAPVSSPEHSPLTPEWNTFGASTKQSPPMQTMVRPSPDYDPNRIPSSIFASKPATPMDWSVASNESLFSIHMGNNSFKSGELTPVMEVAAENHGRSDSMWEDCRVNEEKVERPKIVMTEKTEEIPPSDDGRSYASTPHPSYEGRNSSRSFAFTVFTKEGEKSDSVNVAPDMYQLKPPETPQSQSQAQAACPKPFETRLFSCFSCCPHCC